ncbi:hypothetical protein V1478_008286 [Vespula squamosa]|uniref:Uncharacterized protein n=1 Tax=Vespula squamosa TaxID=30214 RepID=A0ABD2AYC5_VESSQ
MVEEEEEERGRKGREGRAAMLARVMPVRECAELVNGESSLLVVIFDANRKVRSAIEITEDGDDDEDDE